jgi:hypothetical protein
MSQPNFQPGSGMFCTAFLVELLFLAASKYTWGNLLICQDSVAVALQVASMPVRHLCGREQGTA